MSIESENDNIINFPKNKIVRNINNEKPKGFHQKRFEELVWQLQYEFMKGYDAKEFDAEKEFTYRNILATTKENGNFTEFLVIIRPTTFPI